MIFRTNSAIPKTRNMPMKMMAKTVQSFKDLFKSIVEVIKNPLLHAEGFLMNCLMRVGLFYGIAVYIQQNRVTKPERFHTI